MGRPDEISLIFDRRIRSDTPTGFLTKVVTRGVDTTVNFFYRHSRIKEYLKDGRALRIETVVNSPTDLGVLRRLEHLPELISKARDANDRLLHAQRVGQGCVLASPAFERVALSSVTTEGRRAPALRFGDPRVMALVGALSLAIHAVVGFTNRSLRAQVTALLGTSDYSTSQMGYDLARLRVNGLIERLEHSNTYVLTAEGQRVAIFYTRLQEQLLRPLLAADQPPAPVELRAALRTIDQHVNTYIRDARLRKAA
jgi:predicted MarR family transcription regulator